MRKRIFITALVAVLSCIFLCSCQELLDDFEKAINTTVNPTTSATPAASSETETKGMSTSSSDLVQETGTYDICEFGDLSFNIPSDWELMERADDAIAYRISEDRVAYIVKEKTEKLVTEEKLLNWLEVDASRSNLVRKFTLPGVGLSCYEVSIAQTLDGTKIDYDGYGFKYANNAYSIGVMKKQEQGTRDLSCLDPVISSISLIKEADTGKKAVTYRNNRYDIGTSWKKDGSDTKNDSYQLNESSIMVGYETGISELTEYDAKEIVSANHQGLDGCRIQKSETITLSDGTKAYQVQATYDSIPGGYFTYCIFTDRKDMYAVVCVETDLNRGFDDSYDSFISSIEIIDKTTPTPTPTVTPKPTATPVPTVTPVPTETPVITTKPVATPKPTAKPTPKPTSKPRVSERTVYYTKTGNCYHYIDPCAGHRMAGSCSLSYAVNTLGLRECSKCAKYR